MEKVDDPKLNSTIHSNRAHCALLLGNLRRALDDGAESVKLNPSNVKGWFRAAKGALGLEKLEECMGFCTEGLKVDAGNRDLEVMLKAGAYTRPLLSPT